MPCMHMQCPPLSLYLYCTFPQYMNILLGYKVYLQELEWDWRGHFIWMVSSYCISHLTFVHFLTEYNLKKKLEWEPEMSLWFNIHLQSLYAFRSNLCHAVMHCWSSKTGEGKLSLLSPPPFFLPPPKSFPFSLFICHIYTFIFVTSESHRLRLAVQITQAFLLFSCRQMWPFHSVKCHLVL